MNKAILIFLSALLISVNISLPSKSNTILKGMASVNDILPRNTKLKVFVNNDLDSLKNQAGDEFNATVLTDFNVNDIDLIPVGSIVIGYVEDIMHAGKASMQGTIEVSLDKIVLPSGKYLPLSGARFAADRKYTNKNHKLKGEGNGLAKGVGIGVLRGATLTFIPGRKAVRTTAVGVAATTAIFSGGWSVTSTAVIGGITGLAYGLKKHGQEVMIARGQELEILLDSDQDLTLLE
ncbi:MAG: hypothetical protein HYY52_05435 [Candidatus Melainabacteria bacterium]|nr:hypothetical protein [Candidatus Melainabacteria bacterium]